MFGYEAVRNAYDVVRNPKRYRNDEADVDLDETTEPNQWRDSTHTTWTERLASRKRQAIAVGFLGLIVLGIIGAYSRTYLPGLYGNQLLRDLVKATILGSGTFIAGVRLTRSKLRQLDWLVLIMPAGGLGVYLGSADEDTNGNTRFEPVKGFRLWGMKGAPLTLGDLSDDMARYFAKQGRQPDDPAKIRVEDALNVSRDTMFGSVTGVLTGGLEIDEHATESDLYTVPPSLVDDDRYRELRNTLKDVEKERDEFQRKFESEKDDKYYWKNQATKRREDIKQDIVETHTELSKSGFAPTRRGGRQATPGEEAMANGEGG